MKYVKGMTLVELLVVIAMLGIVLAIGIPGFDNLMRGNRVTTGFNNLLGAFHAARSEALTRGVGVTVCPSNDQQSCSGGDAWEDGWIVFTDPANLGTYNAASETIVRVRDGLDGAGQSFSATRVAGSFGNSTFVHFDREGFLRGFAGGSITVCDSGGAPEAEVLNVVGAGQPHQGVDSDGSGVVEDWQGGEAACP